MNFFQFHRPPKVDIDAWEKLGNPGWNWDLLKKYYMKAETFVPPNPKDDSTMSFNMSERGVDGPIFNAYAATMTNLEGIYQETLRKARIARADEPCSGDTSGTWLTPISVHPTKRVRSYAANMYYQPNASRPNLKVLVEAHVSKIVLGAGEAHLPRADFVRFLYNEQEYEVPVGKEVVVSAGAIMSPQLSEIGDPYILGKAGIDLKVTLPGVGNNIQEHIYCAASYELHKDKQDVINTFAELADPAVAAEQLAEYRLHGRGLFGMGLSSITFAPLEAISPDAVALRTTIEESIARDMAAGDIPSGLGKQLNLQMQKNAEQVPGMETLLVQAFMSRPNLPKAENKLISLNVFLNHPYSRGSIHVKSDNPLEAPAIDPRYFERDFDLKAMVEIVKFNRRLTQQEPFCSVLNGVEVNPGPECQTDAQIAEWVKATFGSTWHTVGSCSMLPLEDGGVVDSKLKVYNTSNIRVVDISIIPLHIAAHTQATAYAIGELAADIIKGVVFV